MDLPIPYTKHTITQEDIEAVTRVLTEGALSQGPQVAAFEAAVAAYCGGKHGVAVASGSAALHLAVRALGIKPGQKVITTANTFIATATSVLHNGGEVEFADIDPDTFCIDIGQVRAKLQQAKRGTYAGIIIVHFAGLLLDLAAWRQLADEYSCWLLEDASHALGATRIVGDQIICAGNGMAHATVFSFHPTKHITTGEGGMVVTSSDVVAQKVRLARSNYLQKPSLEALQQLGGWYLEMAEPGFNYRLSDINAALGMSQFQRLEKTLETLRQLAELYDEQLRELPIQLPSVPKGVKHAYHLYIIRTTQRRQLYDYLRSRQILPQVHYVPMHLQPVFHALGWKAGQLTATENYYNQCLSIPLYPTLQSNQHQYVVDSIKAFFTA